MILYRVMENEGFKLNDIIFLFLLFVCSYVGLIWEGWECFINMIGKYNIFLIEKYRLCMIDFFVRGG